ncbi:MAG: NTP transferase domain-containing protein [Candidatus Nomurabacteria bacterium]|jgi:UTP--glucose-1-phosphate uridylyltransferase|nr:NTP transferase domain-containing protein [Candidatus Nomurabacteria bacterium]
MSSFVQPKKAIILAAGSGTRFLPQTKAIAKEMLPILDKPVIQWIVEDLVSAGVRDIICVITPEKGYIEKHFSRDEEYEKKLAAKKGKEMFAEAIRKAGSLANFSFIFQGGAPLGNARPVLDARDYLTPDEPFFVFSADDVFRCPNGISRASQLLASYNLTGKTTICLQEVEKKMADKYGMVRVDGEVGKATFKVTEVVEKPGEANAPSNLATLLGYILTPEILPIVAEEKVDKSGEITLADSINDLLLGGGEVFGCVVDGIYHDAGNPVKYVKAVIDFALNDERFAPEISEYIKSVV